MMAEESVNEEDLEKTLRSSRPSAECGECTHQTHLSASYPNNPSIRTCRLDCSQGIKMPRAPLRSFRVWEEKHTQKSETKMHKEKK